MRGYMKHVRIGQFGRNKSYLSNVIKNGRTLDNYEIVEVEA